MGDEATGQRAFATKKEFQGQLKGDLRMGVGSMLMLIFLR